MRHFSEDERSEILLGWQDIAFFLEVHPDTARTYEGKGMPVQRARNKKVFVTKGEIHDWYFCEETKVGAGI